MSGKIAIIGGSGLYAVEQLTEIEEHKVETPFGSPSDCIVAGKLAGVEVLFLPRHGKGHVLNPSEINYRANVFALKLLGAKWLLSVSAVGSLSQEVAPGDIVLPDQIIDRTRARASTFFEQGVVAHVSLAEPYCPVFRSILRASCEALAPKLNFNLHAAGTFVCMEGPAFSTKAESYLYRSWGAKIIGMTSMPEAKLAREAELAYATLALVTDYDCWNEAAGQVEVSHVVATMQRNTKIAKSIILELVPKLAQSEPSALAAHALKHAIMTDLGKASKATAKKLKPLLGKYL